MTPRGFDGSVVDGGIAIRSCQVPAARGLPPQPEPRRHPVLPAMQQITDFSRSWTALRTAIAELSDEDFAKPSGCTGWLVRDLVCHLIIDAQDVLITLVTPAQAEPTRNAVTYWDVSSAPPTGDDPLDALTVRWPPRTRSRGCSSSTSTTSAPPPAAPPHSLTRGSGSAPVTRSSPPVNTSRPTSWSGRCTTLT
jgi:Mycothiol maleylpyruvate isomerase N-terminal domain